MVRVDPDVFRIERDELGAKGAGVRRHDGEEALMRSHRQHRSHRLHHLAGRQRGERLRDGGNEVLVMKALLNSRLVEHDDVHHTEHFTGLLSAPSAPGMRMR